MIENGASEEMAGITNDDLNQKAQDMKGKAGETKYTQEVARREKYKAQMKLISDAKAAKDATFSNIVNIAGQAISTTTNIMALTMSDTKVQDNKKGSLSSYKWSKRMKDIRKKRISALQRRNNTSGDKKRNFG